MMKKGLDLAEYAAERRRWRAAHPEEARLRDENRKLFNLCMIQEIIHYCDWHTQTEAAKIVGVHRGNISRAVCSGKLRTNGEGGRFCLVCPRSLLDYFIHLRAGRSNRRQTEAMGRG